MAPPPQAGGVGQPPSGHQADPLPGEVSGLKRKICLLALARSSGVGVGFVRIRYGFSTQVPFHRPRPDDTQLGTSGPGAVITYCQPPPQVLHTDTTLHHYTHTYCISILHGLPGSPYGPTGFANCEVDPAGAQGHQADSLSVVYWWLAVIVKKT